MYSKGLDTQRLCVQCPHYPNGNQSATEMYQDCAVTRQLADKPSRSQSSRGLVNSRTSQLAEMFDLKCGVYK